MSHDITNIYHIIYTEKPVNDIKRCYAFLLYYRV